MLSVCHRYLSKEQASFNFMAAVTVSESCSVVSNSATPWTAVSVDSPSKRPEWVSLPPPGDLPNPGIEARSPTLQADSLPAEPQGKPLF